jgi:hypothetical protein
MSLIRLVRFFKHFKLDLKFDLRRRKLLKYHKISKILDVRANGGNMQ